MSRSGRRQRGETRSVRFGTPRAYQSVSIWDASLFSRGARVLGGSAAKAEGLRVKYHGNQRSMELSRGSSWLFSV